MSGPQLPYSHTDAGARTFYHGTKADLKHGDMLQGGYSSNYTERRSPWIYFSETVFAATWERNWQRAKARAGPDIRRGTYGPIHGRPQCDRQKVSG
jgi:hypothetical protein